LLFLSISIYSLHAHVSFHVAPKIEECFVRAIDRVKGIGCPEHEIDENLSMIQLMKRSIKRLETEPKFVDTCCGDGQYCTIQQLEYYFCL
ncbi:hypothetical protein PMAYCL1PPCAC_30011, partial [Pristionchus mayeri]